MSKHPWLSKVSHSVLKAMAKSGRKIAPHANAMMARKKVTK